MQKTFFVGVLILCAMMSFFENANAQKRDYTVMDKWTMGEWYSPAHQVHLILQPTVDYTADDLYDAANDRWGYPEECKYQITMNGQSYQDTYWLNGTTLNLNNYTAFTIVGLDENNLYMHNMYEFDNPTVFHFQRKGTNPIQKTVPKNNQQISYNHLRSMRLPSVRKAERAYNKNSTKVLASQNGVSLTEGHFQTQLALTEFILAKDLSNEDLQTERSRMIAQFQANPSETVQGAITTGQTLQQFRQIKQPAMIGVARASIVGEILAMQNHPDMAYNQRMIQKYNPVLAFDAHNKIALSENDFDSFLKILTFQSQLNNPNFQISAKDRNTFKTNLIQKYPSMTLDQKQAFATMDIVYTVLAANWNKLSFEKRKQYAKEALGTNQATTVQVNSGNFGQAKANLQGLLALAQQKGQIMTKETYDFMSKMQLEMDVFNRNMIERIGGGDDYWEIVRH